MRYTIIIEKGQEGYGAYVPDLPGCVAVADTKAEVQELIREAIVFHVEGMRLEGLPIPPAASEPDFVDVRIA